jgi:hypothetical protein
LLGYGADTKHHVETGPEGTRRQPNTPLAETAKLSDPTALRVLFFHGAKMDPEAMFHAIGARGQRNGTATLQVLVEHGADVNYVSKS